MTPLIVNNISELWRLLAVVDMFVLGVCGCYLYWGLRDLLPPPLRRATLPYGVMLAVVAVAVVVNYVSPVPPTPGVKVLAVVGALCAGWAAWITSHVMRRP